MFSVIAYSLSTATTAAFKPITPVVDQHLSANGNFYSVGAINRLMGGMSCTGANTLWSRVVSPSLRRTSPQYITNQVLALFPPDADHLDLQPGRSILLDTDEQLGVEFAGTALAAAQNTIALWLADKELTPISGRIFTIRATAALTMIAGAWVFGALTLVDTLPVGTFQIVGMDAIVPAGVVARLVSNNQLGRPGCPCRQLVSGSDSKLLFRGGTLGEWMTFDQNSVPGIEILGSAAGAVTPDIYLDIIQK